MLYENQNHIFEVQERISEEIKKDEAGKSFIDTKKSISIFAWHKVENGSYQEAVYDSAEKNIRSVDLSCLDELLPIFKAIEEGRINETDLVLIPEN